MAEPRRTQGVTNDIRWDGAMSMKEFSFTVESRFIHQYGLKGFPLMVYCLLREYTVREGGYFEGAGRIADMLNLNRHTVMAIIKNLIIGGFCSLEKFEDGDKRIVHLYKIIRL